MHETDKTDKDYLAALIEQTNANTLLLMRIYDLLGAMFKHMDPKQAKYLAEYHERGGIVNDEVTYDPNI